MLTDRPLFICFIITRGDSIGGAQIHVRDMALALQKEGHRVLILTGSPGDFTHQLDDGGVHWEHIPWLMRPISPFQDLRAILSIYAKLRKFKPDLVSTHTAKAGMVGRVSAFLAGTPSIFTAHGWQFADGIPGKQAKAVLIIEKIVAPLCRKVITVSKYDFELALRKKAVKEAKLVTIHNGLPWKPYLESGADNRSNSSEPCRLIMVARFQEQKDHSSLFKALSEIKHLNWKLELVGDGPGLKKARDLVHNLGLDSRVAFVGQQLDVPLRMENSDTYLLVSNWEGFPRSIIEAMRAGLPVISSNVGGCSESVEDGLTGYLVPKGDVGYLSKKISCLIKDSELRSKMGTAGRDRYEKQFTFKIMYEKSIALYRETLNL